MRTVHDITITEDNFDIRNVLLSEKAVFTSFIYIYMKGYVYLVKSNLWSITNAAF